MGVEGLHPSDVLEQQVAVLIRAACIESSGRGMGVEGYHPSDVLEQQVAVLIRAACIESSGDLYLGIISAPSRRKDAGFPLIF
jgi:hypothetical protein